LVGYADYPNLGPTHAELNAKKLMSLLKNIKSYFPRNSEETSKCIERCYKSKKPNFISLKTDTNIKKF
jgi:transketolase C-terminal domain/subunit